MKQLANAFNQDQTFFKIFPTQFQTENIYFRLDVCKDACDFMVDDSVDLSTLYRINLKKIQNKQHMNRVK